MKMLADSLGNPLAPIKEHTPRGIGDRFRMPTSHHTFYAYLLSNNGIITFVVVEIVSRLCYEVKAFTCDPIMVFRKGVACLRVASTAFLLTSQRLLQGCRFLFLCIPIARIRNGIAIGVGQKLFSPDIHTTSGLRDTRKPGNRHFTNDEGIPTARRLFQRDLFRVSTQRAVHSDLDFTEFRNFQPVKACACFSDWTLTNTFRLSQTPRQRTDRTLELRVSFLFLFGVLHRRKKCLYASSRRLSVDTCISCGCLP